MAKKVITTIPEHGDHRFKQWARDISGVDKEKQNAYAFEFDRWLNMGRKEELEVGTHVLLYGEEGSRQYHDPTVRICRVNSDGSLETMIEADGADWVLDIRDDVAELIEKPSDLEEKFSPSMEDGTVEAFGHTYKVTVEEDQMMGGTTAWVKPTSYQGLAKLTGAKSSDPDDPTYEGGEKRVRRLLEWVESQVGSDRTVFAYPL